MRRRDLIAASASLLAAPSVGRAQRARVVKFVPHANLTSVDPIWTTANITRNHGYMVYDTLYGMSLDLEPQPQMAAGHEVEADGRIWTITLRDGLVFHDGEKVRAIDAVASLRRWMKRSPFGQRLEAVTDDLTAVDDTRIRFRLKKAFPLLPNALAAVSTPAFVMPERVARTDPFRQIEDTTGSGPFRFKQDEFNSGSLIVYERHAGYVPRSGAAAPSLTAGPKAVHLDRVEWHIITDPATSAAAIQQGEIDWYEQPTPELQTQLRRARNVAIEMMDPRGMLGILRLNHLHSPFSTKALRQALLPAIVQSDYMNAIVGLDRDLFRDDVGVFTPETPMASDAGLEPLRSPRSFERARALMREAGYASEPMRVIGPTEVLAPAALTQVGGDMFRRLGFNLDLAVSDWGTVVQRRGSREPVERGGWSAFFTAFSSFDFLDPASHPLLRGNGATGYLGWPTIPRLEELRDAWFDAPDVAARRSICADIQRVALDEVAYVPLGAYRQDTAIRRNLTGRVLGLPAFWGLRLT
jgi:peptide/nickel transport system substrate-binding protein